MIPGRPTTDATGVTITVGADPLGPAFDRRGEPTTIGVAFGPGETDSTDGWSLHDVHGPVPLEMCPLDRWADGSIRWMLVDFQADVAAGAVASYQLRQGAATGPRFERVLQIDDAGDAITVGTGAATFRIERTGHTPFSSIVVNDVAVLDGEGSGIVATDASGATHRLSLRSAVVERPGALRAVVRLEGRLALGDGAVEVVARLHFFAGLGSVRVDLSVTNPRAAAHPDGFWDLGDAGSVSVRDLSMVWAAPKRLGDVFFSAEPASPLTLTDGPVEIYQDSSGGEQWRSVNHVGRLGTVPLAFRGYRIRAQGVESQGYRATPLVRASMAGVEVAIAVPQFWQNFPKAIEVNGEALTLRLWPRQSQDPHELQGGERKTHTFYLCAGPDSVTDLPLDWTRSPVLAFGDRLRYQVAEACHPLRVGSEEAHTSYEQLVDAAIEGPDSFAQKRETIDEFGWRHFGDIYADHEAVRHPGLISHYNNQYDAIAGAATRFCQTGDRRWWGLMNDLASHVVDVDIYHCATDKSAYNSGMFWHTSHYASAHTATHRSYSRLAAGAGGGPSNEHNYTTGLMLHYFLTGREQSREAVLQLATWVLDMDDGARSRFWWIDRGETGLASSTRETDYHGPGRGAAYSINALLDAHRLTGEERYLAKADRLIDRCIHPADDPDALRLLDAERRWSYTVFLQVLGKYLDYRVENGLADSRFDYARAALLRYAEWMVARERPYLDHSEQLENPTETWAAQDIRKAAVLEFAAAYADNEKARDRFTDRARRFFEYSVATLEQMPTRTLARPVVLLLAYGFQRPLSDVARAIAGRPVVGGGMKHGSPFVEYRRRVTRKLAGLGAATFLLLVLLGIALWLKGP